jgi:hypothetical protein
MLLILSTVGDLNKNLDYEDIFTRRKVSFLRWALEGDPFLEFRFSYDTMSSSQYVLSINAVE